MTSDGFAICNGVFDRKFIVEATALMDDVAAHLRSNVAGPPAYGIRQLLENAPAIREWTERGPVRGIVDRIASPRARVVRAIYFYKTPEANWKVAWHQDLTIAVRERREIEGFINWSTKGGVHHVQPPVSVLEKILTVRIHLDQTDETNGALKVIPGSHLLGRLAPAEIERCRAATEPVLCNVPAGGALLMRPLLLHASSAGTQPSNRRVVHLEFSADALPGGLEWYGT